MGHTRTRRNNQQKRYDMGSAGMVGYKGLIAGQTTANDEVAHNINLP